MCRRGHGQSVAMARSSVNPGSKFSSSFALHICVLAGLLASHTLATDALPVPQQLSILADLAAQQLSISWVGGAATTFDLTILRTELDETVFFETISVASNPTSGRQQWNWTSAEPLECTSLSVQVRSRDGQSTSKWSDTLIHQGNDLPTNTKAQVYPQDKVVPVGDNTTICCVVKEKRRFGSMFLGNTTLASKLISRRTYTITVVNQRPSGPAGTNVYCLDDQKTLMDGTVVFVGYPPLPTDFVCETRDLTTTVCQWNVGRESYLYGKRGTNYFINGRRCAGGKLERKVCPLDEWGGNWTLVARNSLGQHELSDASELSHRVCPVAPVQFSAVTHAWNATVLWQWEHDSYYSLSLACQVELTCMGVKTKRTFTGVGLRSVVVSNLYPDEDHSVKVRCGAQRNFWKWGDWSEAFPFRTNVTFPDAPDVWVWINGDNTGQLVWKPMTHRQSHGQIRAYKVTFWSPEENEQHSEVILPNSFAAPVNLSHFATFSGDRIVASVIAENMGGASPPSSVLIPLNWTDKESIAASRAVYADGIFPLSWQSNENATCGYVVEWHQGSCTVNCPVKWIKVAPGSSNASIESADFLPGVRYHFSLYSCSSEPVQLLQRWQGYMKELVPSSPVTLAAHQEGSDLVLSWDGIPLVSRRGFILGYSVYISDGSTSTLLANITDPEARAYRVKGYSTGTYKFTVKTYTSAGEDTGATASVTLERYADWLILEILTSLGIIALFMVILAFICCKKRNWVKKAFYPDIPEPKLTGVWSRTQGPLDVKPSPNSVVHIVEKPEWDSSKEMLVVIPEEDEGDEGQMIGDEPVDTDEPTSIRYYNQVVDERPIRPRFPDSSASSASSLDSARTDVTYTGIQTSASSLVWPADPQGPGESHQPLADLAAAAAAGGGGGGYKPQMQTTAQTQDLGLASPESPSEPQADFSGGYKPQSSWHFDSPTEAGEGSGLMPSLGSPTSVASTQFLLPDGEDGGEERRQPSSSASTWFTNLLSSSKP
ncbi:LIF receptor subunit alpha a [Nelusetta ayraudi]|uniref:LIF receptor subunit alpha a n=1 Tax=Nelusetta ayraudi TaxID=303726 RepID=UPI003F70AED1